MQVCPSPICMHRIRLYCFSRIDSRSIHLILLKSIGSRLYLYHRAFTEVSNEVIKSFDSLYGNRQNVESTFSNEEDYVPSSIVFTPSYPLYLALSVSLNLIVNKHQNMTFVDTLLSQICFIVDILLCILSSYVIYCLLLTNIDFKTYRNLFPTTLQIRIWTTTIFGSPFIVTIENHPS